jgi:nucleoid-associated protein YgaU
MATLADTLDLLSGTFSITISTPPINGVVEVVSGKPKFVATDANGAFTTTLAQGTYTVRIPNTPSFTITIPSGSATYDLEDVRDTAGVPPALTAEAVFATSAALRASGTVAQIVWVSATGASADQDGGFFKRDGTGTDDGVNVIVRDDGTIYERIGA